MLKFFGKNLLHLMNKETEGKQFILGNHNGPLCRTTEEVSEVVFLSRDEIQENYCAGK